MNAEDLKLRTKKFGLRVLKLVRAMPSNRISNIVSNQLLRAAFSVGANYRAACRARSKAEFAAKIGISIEEADESLYWMEIISESGLMKPEQLVDLMREADELVAILTASRKTARKENVRKRV